MTTSSENAFRFCQQLHERIAGQLSNSGEVRRRVSSMLAVNSFRESCFCKGFVLPIVDSLATEFLGAVHGASRGDVRRALRCEGFETPLYSCAAGQVGFSSHSRSNSYHPGDKSGRRASSRRSPDFCIRFRDALRVVGELKYVERAREADTKRVVHELGDYLSIDSEPTSDWGHDFGYGFIYEFGRADHVTATAVTDFWTSDHIFVTVMAAG